MRGRENKMADAADDSAVVSAATLQTEVLLTQARHGRTHSQLPLAPRPARHPPRLGPSPRGPPAALPWPPQPLQCLPYAAQAVGSLAGPQLVRPAPWGGWRLGAALQGAQALLHRHPTGSRGRGLRRLLQGWGLKRLLQGRGIKRLIQEWGMRRLLLQGRGIGVRGLLEGQRSVQESRGEQRSVRGHGRRHGSGSEWDGGS